MRTEYERTQQNPESHEIMLREMELFEVPDRAAELKRPQVAAERTEPTEAESVLLSCVASAKRSNDYLRKENDQLRGQLRVQRGLAESRQAVITEFGNRIKEAAGDAKRYRLLFIRTAIAAAVMGVVLLAVVIGGVR